MRRTAAVALALFLAVAGCAKVPVRGTAGRHAWTVAHVLRVADVSDPDHLNPYLSEMDISYDVASLIYSYLVVADDRGRLVPDLAAAVPTLANGGISADGRTVTYHLRRNVRWHDGKPFTSRDVAASWAAVMNPSNDTFENEGYDRVLRVETPDPWTAVVRLRERYPPFVTRFFAPLQEGGKPVLPAHVLAREKSFNAGELASAPIGTGPFEFVSWQRADRIVLRRFDGYFRGRPALERIELRIIPSDQTIASELQAHRVDLIVAPGSALLDRYRAAEGVTVETAPWNSQAALIVNAAKPALREVAVRRALALLVPYGQIIDDVTHNVAVPARNSLPVTAIGYEPLPARRYDAAAAAKILGAAGWAPGPDGIRSKNGVRLSITLSTIAGFTNFERMGVLIQAAVRPAGIELFLKNYPYRTIFATPNGPIYGGSYDIALYGDTVNWDPDVYNFLGCDRFYPVGQNIFHYCDPQLDALERAGLKTDDSAQRAAIYRKASRIIWSTVPYIPVYDARRLVVRNDDLKNYRPNMTSAPWWNAWQWDI